MVIAVEDSFHGSSKGFKPFQHIRDKGIFMDTVLVEKHLKV